MKRVLTVVLTVVLALSLVTTAYAGELVLGGKEAGANVTYQNGEYNDSDIYIKVGSLDFQDGTFVFHVSDLQVKFVPKNPKKEAGEGATDVTLNLDYGKWYAKTGSDTFEFTLSNDRGNWVGYKGELKPAAKITDNDDHRTLFLATGNGTVAGLNVGFNLYETYNGVKDMNVTASTTFDSIAIAGFIGDFNGVDYYGGDIALNDVIAGAKLWAGVYANKDAAGDGLAYRVELSDLKAGAVTVAAGYRVGNDKVETSSSWKDGNIPGKDSQEFWAKGTTTANLFEMDHNLGLEFTRDMKNEKNTVKLTDGFDISELVKSVSLDLTFKTNEQTEFAASAGIFPAAGLEIWPKLTNKFAKDDEDSSYTVEGAAQYKVDDNTVLRGGVRFADGAVNRYFVYGDSTGTYGTLNTMVAGMYYKNGDNKYTRAFGKATTNINEDLTDVGAKVLYKKDDDEGAVDAFTRVAFGGKYAISPDTSLSADYVITSTDSVNSHLYVAVTKTIGSATFTLSYGDGAGYEGKDDDKVDKPSWKEWITKGNVPWRELFGPKDRVQNTIKASVKVAF